MTQSDANQSPPKDSLINRVNTGNFAVSGLFQRSTGGENPT